MSGQKTVGTDGHLVADWTRESPAMCACLESGAWQTAHHAGHSWDLRTRVVRVKLGVRYKDIYHAS